MSGLINLGNTCFFNSVIQSLFHTDKLREYLESSNRNSDIKKLFKKMSYGKTVSPVIIKNDFNKYNKIFDNQNQHDSHECLMYIFPYLHDKLKDEKDKSIISKIFQGNIKKKKLCTFCGTKQSIYETFNNISLGIQKDNLIDNIKYYFNIEEFELDCSECKQKTIHQVKSKIYKYPETLIIHLKRFNNHGRKVDKVVNVNDILKFNKHSYSLYSIISHSGTINSGHYYNMSVKNGIWKRFSDCYVNTMSKYINDNSNYIYFYKKS